MKELIRDIDLLAKPATATKSPNSKQFYIETYGCQMNFSDSEIVASVLQHEGFAPTDVAEDADLIFINTCSIRENAEQKVRNRLMNLNALKKKKPGMLIGVLGCMAERLKQKLLEEEKMVDLVAGPDAYRDLPKLVTEADKDGHSINVFLSREETYADISPVRLKSNGVSAFISITRGCDNMCSFCVVPFTRGRERSRHPDSILAEAQNLFSNGYKEVTLLGQNVDSYKFEGSDFADLLQRTAAISPALRVRFTTSHPKDMTNKVLHTMATHPNICKCIHLPVQSGNTQILDKMNRTYTREWYLDRVQAIRDILGPTAAITTDIITGFCGETEAQHNETLSIMERVQYDYAYMFAYSERPGTLAARKYPDDVPEEVKKRRLQEVIALQSKHSLSRLQNWIGQQVEVLVEGTSKRSDEQLTGRTSQNHTVVFNKENYSKGQYVTVTIERCTQATLIGTATNNQ